MRKRDAVTTLRVLCLRLSLSSLFLGSVTAGADEESQELWRQRLISEAIPHWLKLKASMPSASGSISRVYSYHAQDPKDPEFGNDHYIKDSGMFVFAEGAERYIFDRFDKSGKWLIAWIYCSNPDYSFIQSKTIENQDFATTEYGKNVSLLNSVKMHMDRARWITVSYNAYLDAALTDLVKDEKNRVVSWSNLSQNGRKLVEIELDYPPSPSAAVWDPSIRRTRLILDASADWRVVSSHTSCDKIATDLDVTYEDDSFETGRIAKIEYVVHEPNRDLDNLETVEFSSLSFAPLAVDDLFYLPRHPHSEFTTNASPQSTQPEAVASISVFSRFPTALVSTCFSILLAAITIWWIWYRRDSIRPQEKKDGH